MKNDNLTLKNNNLEKNYNDKLINDLDIFSTQLNIFKY